MNAFIASVFLGIIGAGYVMYGRRAHNPVALVAGVLLCVFPYFVDTFTWTMLIGVMLLALPFGSPCEPNITDELGAGYAILSSQ